MEWIIKLLQIKVNNLDKKIPNATTLIHINQYNTDKQNFEKKKTDTSGLVTNTVRNTKTEEVQNKIPDHANYYYSRL